MSLRLVCKAFDRAMTRAYFKDEAAMFFAYEENATQRLQDFIIDERAVIGSHVTRLEIELANLLSDPFEPSKGFAANLKRFISKLEEALSRLPRLESLVFDVGKQLFSDEPVYIDSDDEEEKEKEHGPVVDMDLVESVRSSISRVFRSPHVQFRLLTYLSLTLFSAYDLATIGIHITDGAAIQLRHLYLEYTDGTGQSGSLDYTRYTDYGNENDHDYMPFSNLQRRFPNKEYMEGVCKLISRCRNLKSLGLVGTQCLDIGSLDWQPTGTGMENIYLRRILATSATLLALLSPLATSNTPASNTVAFDIKDVQLWDGSWETIFDHLALSSSLGYLDVYNLVYAELGDSTKRAMRNSRPFENFSVLWSEDEDDWQSLSSLAKRVKERGGNCRIDDEDLS
jgi:hypothetical protein